MHAHHFSSWAISCHSATNSHVQVIEIEWVWVHYTPNSMQLSRFPHVSLSWWNTECFNKIFKAFITTRSNFIYETWQWKLWIPKKHLAEIWFKKVSKMETLTTFHPNCPKILEFGSRRKFEMSWILLPPKVTRSPPPAPPSPMQNFSM